MQEVRGHPLRGSHCSVSAWFQVYFTPLIGVLFTFPSRYSFTIGRQDVLSLGRWSSQIPSGFLVPQGTQVCDQGVRKRFAYGGLTLYAAGFNRLLLRFGLLSPRRVCSHARRILQPRPSNACRLALNRFGLVPVRSPLLGESRLISVPAGT
jgi:hypothetical protein